MTSYYTHDTAIAIYTGIASFGAAGADIDELIDKLRSLYPDRKGNCARDGFAGNTIRTYCRWMEGQGSVSISGVNSEARNRPVKNLYVAIQRPPGPSLSELQRLLAIAALLESCVSNPKTTKTEMASIMQQALRVAKNKTEFLL